jgi:putative transposase
MFNLFDYHEDFRVTCGNLPHWFQPGVTYFVTFRTEDSLPKDVADRWYRRRDDWLRRCKIDPTSKSWKAALEKLPQELQRQFHKEFSEEYLALLDKGYGKCSLADHELAGLVSDSLLHFDGLRYDLGDFVVMPNHIHLLVCLRGATEIEKQCYSLKKFSASKINERLKRTGRFWQEESFDHLVRSCEAFERFQLYIARNGESAGLGPGQYLYRKSQHSLVVADEITRSRTRHGTRSVPAT